jgi:O-antigen/teichoic acid export membrane protein
MFNRIKVRHEFFWNVLTTLSGSMIAQAIPVAVMPLLALIYLPSEFGTFSLYIAISSICAIIATGRFELAIMLPKSAEDSVNIVAFSSILLSVMTGLFFVIISFFHSQFVTLLGDPNIGFWLYFIPIPVFFTGLFQILSYWTTRNKQFSLTSMGRMAQGAGTAAGQLTFGPKILSSGGLIVGHILGAIVSVIFLSRLVFKSDRASAQYISFDRMKSLFKKYRGFPIYSLWGAILDNVAVQMPIFILSKFYSAHVTGLFSLTFRMLNLPMVIIASSISGILFQKITYIHNHDPKLLHDYIVKAFLLLLGCAFPVLFIVYFGGSELVTFVFGEAWADSGKYASIIVIATTIRFAVSPLSSVLAIEHNLRLGVLWQVTYFVSVFITLYVASAYPVDMFIKIYTMNEVVFYLFYLGLILVGTRRYQSC